MQTIAWTRLIVHERSLPIDLDLAPLQRVATLLALCATEGMLEATVLASAPRLAGSLTATMGVAALNFDLSHWFARIRGVGFALRAIPMQMLHCHDSMQSLRALHAAPSTR